MENEENFNWLEMYVDIQEGKDIKNSPAFKLLNSNNIDTNELTKTEKDKNAGVVELNYKDEKEKEVDKRSFAKGALAFVADMPEETMKALMMAFLNGTDVAANFTGVVFNAMTNQSPAIAEAFKNGNAAEFKKLVNSSIQEFSKYLSNEKNQVKAIGEGSELDSKVAEFVSMVTQDTPYSLPIYKKLTSLGMPKYMALPVAYGIGSGVAFNDDAQIFLNSEQVQSFKEMSGALPNSSEEKIFNTVYRTLEGTALGFAIPYVFQGLKFAKNTIPKYMTPQTTIAAGTAASVGAVVDNATASETITFDQKIVDKLTDVQEGDRIQGVIDGLAQGLPDNELQPFLDEEFPDGTLQKIKSELGIVTEDILKNDIKQSDNITGNILTNDIKQSDNITSNQDMQNMITKAEKADDQVLFFDGDRESGQDDPINDYIKITDPKALEGADIVFYDDETMEQMTYQKINESDDNWIILNEDRKTSYNQ